MNISSDLDLSDLGMIDKFCPKVSNQKITLHPVA